MKNKINRRDFLKTTGNGCLTAAALMLGLPTVKSAYAAKTKLSIVEWGPPWIDATKKVAKKWDKVDFTWTLHSGGAASVLPKIKSSWPNPPYDLVDVWNPVFEAMIKEDWAETVTAADCPNLKDVPEDLITKDKNGNWKNIPRGMSGTYFCTTQNCPIEVKTIDDLLSPKLKGQILWPNPTLNTNAQVINLAIAAGGDQYNLEPGWDMLKKIAKMGNIGRIAVTTSDLITSLETGETSVAYIDQGSASGIKGAKIRPLTKVDESLKAFIFIEGWMVLKSSKKKKEAFEFANFTINKENSEIYCEAVGESPCNSKAESAVTHLRFNPEELKKFVVIPDWSYLSTQLDSWNKKFEKEIVPLL